MVSLGDIVNVAQLALAVDDIQSVLGQTGSGGVAVGVSPGTEAASAAGLADRVLDLGQDLLEVAGLSGRRDSPSKERAGRPR